jgi:hypothetical protein
MFLATASKRRSATNAFMPILVLCLTSLKSIKSFLITIDDCKTVSCFAYPEVQIGGMTSKLVQDTERASQNS